MFFFYCIKMVKMRWAILSLFWSCLLHIWDDIIDTLWFLVALFSLSLESVILHSCQQKMYELKCISFSPVIIRYSKSFLFYSSKLISSWFSLQVHLVSEPLLFYLIFWQTLSDYSQICVSFKFIFKSNKH